MKSIKQVAEAGLCIGCGICASICPWTAVEIVKDDRRGIYKPVVSEKCVECGLCVKACYGIGVDPKLNSLISDEDHIDRVLGAYSNCYVGYASDKKIRYSSASGGIVTAILQHALEEKMVGGVLVTKMDERSPLEPRPFIASTVSEVISAARSKYCPVAADVAIKTIMEKDGHYAVVGLPCHIYGVRKAESIYPDLANKILFHIGIFCGGVPNFLATKYLLKSLKVSAEEVMRIEYRGEGWPGKMLIELKRRNDNRTHKLLLPYPQYWGAFGSLFLPYGCSLCADGFNNFADISCGDAWLPEYRNDNLGTSLIIARNKLGEHLIKGAYEKRRIQIEQIQSLRVKQAQRSMVQLKTRYMRANLELLKALGRPVPIHQNADVKISQPTLRDYSRCALFLLLRFDASKRLILDILKIGRLLDTGRFRGLLNFLAHTR